MSRRRHADRNDSLDLLLDTITNTFGGILMVALLLVLLIRNTTAQQANVADNELVTIPEQQRLQAEVQGLKEQCETLRQSIQSLQQLEVSFADPAKQQLAQDLGELLGELNMVEEQESQLQATCSALLAESERLERENRRQRQDAVEREAELASALLELKNELARRTRTMELPREQYTNKTLTCVFLLQGQLYFPDRGTGRAGFRINLDQFEQCGESEANLVLATGKAYRVKPNRGVEIERSAIERNLRNFPAQDFYLTIVCDRESFANFADFKDLLVELGFEHRIMPLAEPRVFETTNNDRAKVQ